MDNYNRTSGKENFSNILIRVPNWLGDTLMATPAVKEVRLMFPEARLTLWAKRAFADFWEKFPGVDEVLPLEKGFAGYWNSLAMVRKKRFDIVLIFPKSFSSAFLAFGAEIPNRVGWGGEGRDLLLTRALSHPGERKKHLVWEYLQLVQEGMGKPLPSNEFKLVMPNPSNIQTEANNLFRKLGVDDQSGMIALAPGATYGPAKRWPLAYWRELMVKLLSEKNETLLVVGGKEEEAYLKDLIPPLGSQQAGRVHWLVGKTSPLVLGEVLRQCKVLITNDTGPMHVSAASGTPTLALFGSTSPTWTGPFGRGHWILDKNLDCSPCFQKTCPIGYRCLKEISVQEVFETLENCLAHPRITGALPLEPGMAPGEGVTDRKSIDFRRF